MKNVFRVLSITALVAVIGFSMTACDDGGGTTGKTAPTVTWPTGLTAAVGQTLADVTLPANTGTAGAFTWTTPANSVGAAGSRTHNMTFTPTDTATYNTVTRDVTITVKNAPTVTWPTGLTATVGQTLADVTLPANTGTAGAFTWTTPADSVGAQGPQTHNMTFTPTDNAAYNTVTQNVTITVSKTDTTVTWPTGLTATVGQTLADITLPANTGTAGAFTWTTPANSVGAAGSQTHNMTFTPADNATYNTVTRDVTITVKTDPSITWPTGLTAKVGQTLADVTLPANTGTAGAFTWTTPANSVGAEGSQTHNMTFTPADTAAYNTVTQNVTVTVIKNAGDYNFGDTGPGGGLIVYYSAAGFTVEAGTGYSAYTAHYLEAAPVNQGEFSWGDQGRKVLGLSTYTPSTDQIESTIGKGRKDTQIIAVHMNGKGITGTAAQVCAALTTGEKTDWFLPGIGELNEMYKQRASLGISSGFYWSSTQTTQTGDFNAYMKEFKNNSTERLSENKNFNNNVRAVRAF